MPQETFIWLRDAAFPRSGPKLEMGKEHNAANYPADVVKEWVKTGAAEWKKDEAPKIKKSGGKS